MAARVENRSPGAQYPQPSSSRPQVPWPQEAGQLQARLEAWPAAAWPALPPSDLDHAAEAVAEPTPLGRLVAEQEGGLWSA